MLVEADLGIDAGGLFSYVVEATKAREFAKFRFSHNLSDALEFLAAWGIKVGLSRNELSHLTIGDIQQSYIATPPTDLERHLRDISLMRQERHQISTALHLPQVICDEEGIEIVPFLVSQANFVTRGVVRGPHVFILAEFVDPPDIVGKIVLIESADPGYDWIFGFEIAGLVTKFGGSNSHMAIRCAEFGIPAAIGCGEQIFDRLLHSKEIEINCAEHLVSTL